MKNKTFRALALDLDGTLTNHNKELSFGNREAVWQAIDQGTAVILATGRPLFGGLPIAQELELEKRGGYVMACNGGVIWDCREKKIIHSRAVPSGCIGDICREARSAGVYALTYDGDWIVSESDEDEYVQKEAFCNGAAVKKVADLQQYVDYPVPKFLAVGEHCKLLPVQKAILEQHGGVLDAYFSEEYFLEIVPQNVEKGRALDVLLQKLGITREELIACGDGLNDISMLRYAGLGVAMENAYPQVKECAQFIAKSNDEDGVAQVIAKFILNSCR